MEKFYKEIKGSEFYKAIEDDIQRENKIWILYKRGEK